MQAQSVKGGKAGQKQKNTMKRDIAALHTYLCRARRLLIHDLPEGRLLVFLISLTPCVCLPRAHKVCTSSALSVDFPRESTRV